MGCAVLKNSTFRFGSCKRTGIETLSSLYGVMSLCGRHVTHVIYFKQRQIMAICNLTRWFRFTSDTWDLPLILKGNFLTRHSIQLTYEDRKTKVFFTLNVKIKENAMQFYFREGRKIRMKKIKKYLPLIEMVVAMIILRKSFASLRSRTFDWENPRMFWQIWCSRMTDGILIDL